MKKTAHIIWALFLVLCVSGFYHKTLITGDLPVPADALVGLYHPWRDVFSHEYPRGVPFKNFLITDPIRQQMPWKKLVIEAWRSKSIPRWNPYAFAGYPLDANIQAGPFYPLNIIPALLPFSVGWSVFILLQSALGILGMYWYLRYVKRSYIAASIGSLAWTFSGFSIAWLTWGTIVHTALWLPFLLLSIEHVLDTRSQRGVLGKRILWTSFAVLNIVLMSTAGHAQIALYVVSFSFIYALWRMHTEKCIPPTYRIIAAVFVLGIAVSALQWIPFLASFSETVRAFDLSLWQSEGWLLPFKHLTQFIAPDYFGNPSTLNYWGTWNYGELIGYIGIAPLVLAFTSVSLGGMPAFFTVSVLISLLFMVQNPIAYIPFFLRIPMVSSMQPTRLMVLVCFSLSVLSSFGYDAFVSRKRRTLPALILFGIAYVVLYMATISMRTQGELYIVSEVAKRNLIVPIGVFTATIAWIIAVKHIFKFKKTWLLAPFIVGIVIADLFRFGWKFTPFSPATYVYPETQITRFLNTQKKPFRIMSLDDRIMPPNVSAFYHIESIEGYDPLAPARFDSFLAAAERGDADSTRQSGFHRIYTAHNIDSPLLPYLNVRYVLGLTDIQRDFLLPVVSEGQTTLYEYTKGLPRVYLAERVLAGDTPQEILALLFTHSPQRVGIVEAPLPLLSLPTAADETAEIVSYSDSEMTLHVSVKNPRLLVILQAYNKGWKARFRDGYLPVVRVNYMFSGIIVPSGAHAIEFRYK